MSYTIQSKHFHQKERQFRRSLDIFHLKSILTPTLQRIIVVLSNHLPTKNSVEAVKLVHHLNTTANHRLKRTIGGIL